MSAEDEIQQAKTELIDGFMPADYVERAKRSPLIMTVRHAIEHHKWHHEMEEGKNAVRLRNDIIDICANACAAAAPNTRPLDMAELIRKIKGRDTASSWDHLADDDVMAAVLKGLGETDELRLSLRAAFMRARDYLQGKR